MRRLRRTRKLSTWPTATGGLLISVCLGVGTAAFNTAHNVLYLALGLLLSSLLLSGVLSWLNFRSCRWQLEVGSRPRAGQAVAVLLQLRNASRWIPIYALSFELHAGRSGANNPGAMPEGPEAATRHKKTLHISGGLEPRAVSRLRWDWVPPRRGRYTVALTTVSSRFPFGFLRKTLRCHTECSVLVWPARLPNSLSVQGDVPLSASGASPRRAQQGEMRQLRAYAIGDEPRAIHWKVSARRGRLTVRDWEDPETQERWLRLNPTPGLWPSAESWERACRLTATLAEDWFRQGILGGLLIDGLGVWPGAEERHWRALMDVLALVDCATPVAAQPVDLPQGAQAMPAGAVVYEVAATQQEHVELRHGSHAAG